MRALILAVVMTPLIAGAALPSAAKSPAQGKQITVYVQVYEGVGKKLFSPKLAVKPGEWAKVDVSDAAKGSSFKAEVMVKAVDAAHLGVSLKLALKNAGANEDALNTEVRLEDGEPVILGGTSAAFFVVSARR